MRPLLEYASPVWNPCTVSCIDSIDKVQRCAARWAMQDYKPTSSVTAMLEELDRTLLHSKRKDRLSTPYKIRHGLLKTD